jgi:F-type H+-transporting ATPase subunit b
MTFTFDPSLWSHAFLFGAGGISIFPDLTIVFQAVFFLVTLLVFKRVMFPPVLRVLLERQKQTERAHQELIRLDEEGQDMERKYQETIRDARLKAQEINNQARKEASDEEHKLLEAARQNAAKALYENTSKLEAHRKEVVAQFDQESETLAKGIASNLLGRTI